MLASALSELFPGRRRGPRFGRQLIAILHINSQPVQATHGSEVVKQPHDMPPSPIHAVTNFRAWLEARQPVSNRRMLLMPMPEDEELTLRKRGSSASFRYGSSMNDQTMNPPVGYGLDGNH